MIKNLEIKLLQKVMYLWDVVFTFIDHTQLKLWFKMRQRLERITSTNS